MTRSAVTDAGVAEVRSTVYAILSTLLAADEAGVDAVRGQLLPSVDRGGGGPAALREVAERLAAALGRHDTSELLRSHRSLFPPVESRDLPAYESAYCGSDIFRQAQQMADIAGFYRAHGLAVGGSRRERPDHVAVELEFMALLAAKEADATLHLGLEHVEMCRHAQTLFLGEHLGRWAPIFAGRLAARADRGPYKEVAEALEMWIAAELQAYDTVPAPLEAPAGPSRETVGLLDDGCAIGAEGAEG